MTHKVSAASITREDHYEFNPTEKRGKPGMPLLESFVDTFLLPTDSDFKLIPGVERQYRKVASSECLLPRGYCSWWGMDASKWICNLDPGTEVRLTPPYCYQNPPLSLYGSVAFSGDLHQLLQSYQRSRQTTPEDSQPDVYILVGGTLRYPTEICCVAIVCTEKDRYSEALRDYRPFCLHDSVPDSDDPVLMLNNLTGGSGKVIDFTGSSIPEFYPRYLSKGCARSSLSFLF